MVGVGWQTWFSPLQMDHDLEAQVCQFVRGLPATLLTLKPRDASWLVNILQHEGSLQELSTLECTSIWEKICSTHKVIYNNAQFAARLWKTLTILYELDKDGDAPPLEGMDADLQKWLESFKSIITKENRPEDRWKTPKLNLDRTWLSLWQASDQMSEYTNRKRLIEWIPQYAELGRAPPYNIVGRQPHPSDKHWRLLDDTVRDIARAVHSFHLALLGDPALLQQVYTGGHQVPPAAVQLENIFVLLGYASKQCQAQRLRAVDPRLDNTEDTEEGLVGTPQWKNLENAKKIQAKVASTNRPRPRPLPRYQPYPTPQSSYGKQGKGQGKSRSNSKGKGKGAKFIFNGPPSGGKQANV